MSLLPMIVSGCLCNFVNMSLISTNEDVFWLDICMDYLALVVEVLKTL